MKKEIGRVSSVVLQQGKVQDCEDITSETTQRELLPEAIADGGPLPSDADAPTTLPQVLLRAAGQKVAESIIYIGRDGTEIVRSYPELLAEAQKILAGLRKQGLKPQDRVILQLEKNWEIVPAFWGSVLGGFVPTIMEVPSTHAESNPVAHKLRQIWKFLDSPFIITNEGLPEKIKSFLPSSEKKVSSIETLRQNGPDKNYYPSQPDETACFNLTSGSTGLPKCVQLTHRNLISRAKGANILNHHQPEEIILNWLPFDHIGSISDWHIRCVELGCKQVYAPREYILGRALNWLDLIDKYRVTHSWAPNFAYSLINDLLSGEENQTWDLSCVQFLLTAGEAVSSQAVEEFREKMAAYHLSKTAIRPAFGMAELGSGITYYQPRAEAPLTFHRVDKSSLKGTIKRVEAEHPNSDVFADLGPVIPGVTIRIVDAENSVLPSDTIGRLQVSGDAVSPGYYNNPEANKETFREDGWFETGDLGFISNGQLVLTGRAKETIIINGTNYYSHEIEAVVEEIEGIEVSYTAACAVRSTEGVTDKLAIFFHATTQKNDDLLGLLRKIRQQVVGKIGVNPDYLIPVPREAIPKTAIGKIQRLQLSKDFEKGEFNSILERLAMVVGDAKTLQGREKIAPRNELEQQLVSIWQDVLKIPEVGVEDNFFELGGSSIAAMMLVNRLQEELSHILHPVALFDAPTIALLADYLRTNYGEVAGESNGKKVGTPTVEKLTSDQTERMGEYLLDHLCGESVEVDKSGPKNKQAIFILCTGRSGSTLLRVIMAGHPQLFAPPELYLLSFNTLAERKAAFSGRNNFLAEGVTRAIMEIKNCDGERAQEIMEELEAQNLSTKEFFSLMQSWLPGTIIADKTPPYAFNPQVLQRAEEEFENPLYIHLLRHPMATIRSMKEARLDLLVAMEEEEFSVEQKGELMWAIAHKNILEFLKNIPSSRQHQLKYEDLVQQPQTTVDRLCEFIGIEFHPDMLEPYKEKRKRMTDGVHAVSRMMGDPKFHSYKGINAKVAERWKEEYKVDFLSAETWKVAESLGYEKPDTGVEWNYPEGEFPLSLGQEFYWFRANPRDIHNTAWRIWHLKGSLNRDALKQTFEEIVLRHEPLRTTYKEVNGLPVQVVHPDTRTLAWLEVDLQDLSAQKQADRVQEYLHKEAYYQFNLLEGPILRVHLLRLSEISHVLMPCTTHLAVDAWSMGILMREIKALYSAIISGQPSPLEKPSMTYTEFVRWEYTSRQQAQETVLDYWKQNLAGVKLPELPTDRPNPSLPSCQQGNVDMTIGDDLTRGIEQLSRKAGVTLSSCCLAAYSLLLKSFIIEGDIVVFSTLGTRPRAEVQSLMGCFASVLPLRINIENNYTVVELMHKVQETFKRAYLHQYLSLSQFMEMWKSMGGLHRPFIPVAFNMVNVINSEELELPNLEIDFQRIERQGVHADFHLRVRAMEGAQITTQFRYRTDLFDFSSIQEVSERYSQFLESMVSYPEQPIHKLLGTLRIAE